MTFCRIDNLFQGGGNVSSNGFVDRKIVCHILEYAGADFCIVTGKVSKSSNFGSSPSFTLKQLNYYLLAQCDGLEVWRETTEGSNIFIGAAFFTGKTISVR